MAENTILVSEIADDSSNIEVKSFLPFGVKNIIIDTILEASVEEDEKGIKRVNYSLLHVMKEALLVANYSNIDLGAISEITEELDELKQKGIVKHILGQIDTEEIAFINDVVDLEIKQIIEVDNSVANVVANGLSKLLDKLPNDKQLKSIGKSLLKDLKKLDPEKLSMVTSAIGWEKGR